MKILPWLLFFIFASGILSIVLIENKISNVEKKKTTGRGGDFHE